MNNHYDPFESDFNTNEPLTENNETQEAEQPVEKNDFSVDEYYKENYSDTESTAENYAKYGEGYYNGTASQQPHTEQTYQPQQEAPANNYQSQYRNVYSDTSFNQPQSSQNNGYSYQNPYYAQPVAQQKPKKQKKEKKPVTRSTLAAVLIICILASASLGVGGGILATKLADSGKTTTSASGSLVINKSDSGSSSYQAEGAALSTKQIVDKAANSVVEITTEAVVTGSFSQQYIQQGAGSGVIISSDGYIITNYHVIEDASHITVTLRDQTEYTDVEVVGIYSDGDLALLKISPKGELTSATFGDSSKLNVGDYSVVIGNPLGQLGGSVTDGIISALDREVTIEDNTMNLLQTNAEISPGNSGGGLFNGNGELIGIVNAKSGATSAEGIGFAIPINDVQDVLSDLKEYGYVKGQVDLGMSLTDVSSTAQLWMFGTKETGVYVTSVQSGSNAEKAGFRSGDVITKVNGETVDSKKTFNSLMDKFKVGDEVTFTVNRSGRTGTIKMELEEYTDSFASSGKDRSSVEDEDEFSFDPFFN